MFGFGGGFFGGFLCGFFRAISLGKQAEKNPPKNPPKNPRFSRQLFDQNPLREISALTFLLVSRLFRGVFESSVWVFFVAFPWLFCGLGTFYAYSPWKSLLILSGACIVLIFLRV